MSQFKTQTILDRDNYFCLPVNNLPACKLPVYSHEYLSNFIHSVLHSVCHCTTVFWHSSKFLLFSFEGQEKTVKQRQCNCRLKGMLKNRGKC